MIGAIVFLALYSVFMLGLRVITLGYIARGTF